MRSILLRALVVGAIPLALTPAVAFDPAKLPSPTYNRLGVDRLTIQGPGSTGDASSLSVRPPNTITAAPLSDLLKNVPRVGDDGAVSILNGPTLGTFLNGRFTAQPGALVLPPTDQGSSGDVSAMSVVPNPAAPDASLAKRLHTPIFGGPVTAPSLTLSAPGSTGDVSAMSVAPSATAPDGSLAKRLHTPTFTGRVTAPALSLTAPGSTGDVSSMTVAPKLGPPAAPLDTLLSAVPVPFSKYGPGGQPGVDATATFAAIRADTTSPTVFLPPGQYEVSECPTDHYFRSNTTLVGAGMGRTRIKFTGTSCAINLFAWGGGRADFGARDLTIDWNGATCANTGGVCGAFYITDNTRARIENVEIVGTTGDRWFHAQVVGSTNGVLRNNRIQPRDCVADWLSNTGIFIGGSYSLSSYRTASISGNTLTVADPPDPTKPPHAIKVGQAVVGGPSLPRDLYVTALGTGTGQGGTYILSKAVPAPVASGTLHLTSTYGWTIENNRIVNTNMSIDSPMHTTRNNEIGPFCTGPGMNTSKQATYHTSIGDFIHDGPSDAGGDSLYDTGLEFHGANTLIADSRVSNVSSACLSYSGGRTIVRGGSCERFNTGAIEDSAFTGSISGSTLTVTSVASGKIQRGQNVTGSGVVASTIKAGGTGTGGVGTYTLDKEQADVASTAMTGTLTGNGGALYASNGDENGSNAYISNYTVRGSGTAGEKACFADNVGATNIRIQGLQCSGTSGTSPYRIFGGTTVANIGTMSARGLTVYDGNPFTTSPKYAAGIATENGGDRLVIGINDSRVGTQITADQGSYMLMQPGFLPFQLYTRAAGAATASSVLNFTLTGGIYASDNITASRFTAGSSAGVSCNGPPTANFQVTGGIVTRC
ncbi:hypothetical protein ASG52_19865 [Methylobacterium sp. Leaf456]|uniref:hypothetical protein n=1 Tax=Methylobacterium sp. Leaf456 TaxID=1736382 RepID=UPI000700380C|nr:hypothetical protein [Methylobacterium sp. Leaf456]KQT59985.1 hypothetical protein ASG52_19865 [Methylobacterium sp. Leaf456]